MGCGRAVFSVLECILSTGECFKVSPKRFGLILIQLIYGFTTKAGANSDQMPSERPKGNLSLYKVLKSKSFSGRQNPSVITDHNAWRTVAGYQIQHRVFSAWGLQHIRLFRRMSLFLSWSYNHVCGPCTVGGRSMLIPRLQTCIR